MRERVAREGGDPIKWQKSWVPKKSQRGAIGDKCHLRHVFASFWVELWLMNQLLTKTLRRPLKKTKGITRRHVLELENVHSTRK